jgi:uncharacterized protein (DUF58 family)
LLLSGLIYLLLLLGLATLTGGLIALALPLVVYLGAALLYGPEDVRLRATRTLSADRVVHGAPLVVKITITNAGSWLEDVLIKDVIPRPLKLTDGTARVVTSLLPGETLEFAYTVRGKRGRFEFQAIQVMASEHLGLRQRQATLMAPAQVFVLPNVFRLRRVQIRPLRTHGYAGPVPGRRGGSGVEFFGVREYQPGDPLRWINWRASTRRPPAFFTNEFEQERIADVGLILDARRRSDVQSPGDPLFEHAVCATASLAERFLNDGNRVWLLVYGGYLDWTLPGYGKVQKERVLQALARAETGESMVFESLDYLPTRFFPTQSQLILISPLCKDDPPMLVRLRARGYQLLVISPNPVTFEAQALGPQPGVELAARIARIERSLLLRKLRQAGIQILDWHIDKPFDQAIHTSLSRLPHWFRAVGVEL